MPPRPRLTRVSALPRRWIVAVLALVLVAVGGVAWAAHNRGAETTTTTTSVAASLQTLRQTVATTGTIAPKSRADLAFPAAGTVTAVKVAAGDSVTAGQPLATMDATDLTDAVQLAQANLDAANAQLTNATAGGNANQIASAQAQVNAAAARLSSAQAALGQATITAPFDGVVASVNVAVGDRVSGASATGSAGGSGSGGGGGSGGTGNGGGSAAGSAGSTTAVTVIGKNAWVVNATVGSGDLAQITKGLQAEITPTGSATKAFGTVSGVGVIASSGSGGSGSAGNAAAGQGVATFPITIDVTGTPAGLYAGGTASVTIVVKQITDALTVPTAAIGTENGQTVVHQDRGGQTVSTPVTIGMVSGTVTQITKGLAEGDEVLVEGRARTPGTQPSGSRTGGGFGNRTGGAGGFGGNGGNGGFGGQRGQNGGGQ